MSFLFQKIKDSALFTKVGILLALDLVVLSIWQLSDPLRHKLQVRELNCFLLSVLSSYSCNNENKMNDMIIPVKIPN